MKEEGTYDYLDVGFFIGAQRSRFTSEVEHGCCCSPRQETRGRRKSYLSCRLACSDVCCREVVAASLCLLPLNHPPSLGSFSHPIL